MKMFYAIFWPKFSDESSARRAAQRGAVVCAISAIDFAIVSARLGLSKPVLLVAVTYLIISLMSFKMSRVGTIAGLAVFLWDKYIALNMPGAHPRVVWTVAILFLIGGIRGAFYYQRRQKSVASTGERE